MKGYSKIKIIHSPSNSRSMDALDLLTSLDEQHTRSNNVTDTTTSSPSKFEETNQKIKNRPPPPKKTATKITNLNNQDFSFLGSREDEASNDNGEISRKLKRNSSVSSTSTLHSTLKKAFSMRRSSSVNERYCRIHDQSSTLPSPTHHHHHDGFGDAEEADADAFMKNPRFVKRKNSRSRILKACKKLIGL